MSRSTKKYKLVKPKAKAFRHSRVSKTLMANFQTCFFLTGLYTVAVTVIVTGT